MRFDVVLALYLRCSFRQSGQCEGLYTVERATRLALTLFLLILPMYGNVAKAQSVNGDIPYAVYDREERTLTFYCTKEKPEGSYGLEHYADDYGNMLPQWTNNYIETIIFDKSFSSARPTDCSYLSSFYIDKINRKSQSSPFLLFYPFNTTAFLPSRPYPNSYNI